MSIRRSRILLLAMLLILPLGLVARHTEVFIDDAIEDFAQGDLTTSTLTYKGIVQPPYDRSRIGDVDADVVWDIAGVQGTRWIATGHEGRILRQSGAEAPALLADLEETTVYAILPDKDGSLLAGASPSGKIHRITPDGKSTVFAETGSSIVWDMVRHDGRLIVATGTKAGVYTVADDGTTATLAVLPDVLNVLDIEPIPGGGDIAIATQGPGLLGRISKDGKVSILLDPEQEEVRRAAVMPDGSIIGAVNGVRSPGGNVLDRTPDKGKAVAGANKPRPESFVVRAHPDGFVEEWWISPESPIHDLHVRPDGSLLIAAGATGSLYEVSPDGFTNRVGVTDEDYATRIAAADGGGFLIGTGATAAIYTLNPAKYGEGIYESRAFDGKGTVQWDRVRAVLDVAGGSIRLTTRSGNRAKPDDTWSAWSEPVDFASGEALGSSPVARFMQYRLLFTKGTGEGIPSVDIVRVFYTRPNTAPVVKEITYAPPKKPGQSPAGASANPPGRVDTPPNSNPEAIEISWKAEDSDADRLLFDVSIQKLGEKAWITVEEDLEEPSLVLATRGVPDGEYRIRIVARDTLSNEAASARTAECIGGILLIDNTPPDVILLSTETKGAKKVVRFRVEDKASLVGSVAWRADFDELLPLLPEDGAFDQRSETFVIEADATAPFPMVVATDEIGNSRVEHLKLD